MSFLFFQSISTFTSDLVPWVDINREKITGGEITGMFMRLVLQNFF